MKNLIQVIFISILLFSFVNLNAQGRLSQPGILYKNITIINPVKKGAKENYDVLVERGYITHISKTGKMKEKYISSGVDAVDATGKFIIAGLTDGHIHLFQSGGLYTRPDAIDLQHRVSYDSNQAWVKENIDDYNKRYIACGITNVIDCGGPDWNFEERAKQKNRPHAPNLYVSGPLITPWRPEVYDREEHPFTVVESKREAIKEVKRQLEFKPDFIKIWYIVDMPKSAEDLFPTIEAICETAHEANTPVWVHATQLETAKYAIKAGCDVLVHMPKDEKVDEEFLKLAKDNDVMIIPTMWVFESYSAVFKKQLSLLPIEHRYGNPFEIGTFYEMHELDSSEIGEKVLKRIASYGDRVETSSILLYNTKAVADYGIDIAAGTDAGNIGVLHGPSLFHEFALMKKAGLTDEQILKSATINGAKLLNHFDEYGSIEEGKKADFVILNSNPLEDINNTQDIHLVCKGGIYYTPEDLVRPTPTELAQMQLNGYNERNIEAFLAPYAEDVEIFLFPDEFLYQGKEEMRDKYTEYFKNAGEKLHCKLDDRLVYKNFIFDKESLVTGIKGREKFNGQAVYQIKNDKIFKVWFIK